MTVEPMSSAETRVGESAGLLRFLRRPFLMLAVLGLFRIFVGAIGVPESVGIWVTSGTLLSLFLAVYFGHSAPSHGFNRYWHFILIGWSISIVESLVVIAGIAITTNFGLVNYFGSERVPVKRHIEGHLGSAIGGNLTMPLVILAGIGFVIGRRKVALANRSA